MTAGATAEDDVLLVLRPVGQQLETVPDRWTEATAGRVWGLLRRLQDIGIAHGQVDDRHLVVDGDEVGLLDFRGATVAPAKERMRTDEAQTLVTTVLALGEGPALMVAVEALGAGCLAAVLPFVQPPALTPLQRGRVRQAGLDLDDLRGHAARLAGVEAPELQRLRRVTLGSVLQVGLLAVAFLTLASAVAGLDPADLGHQLGAATLSLVAAGVLLAQLPRLAQAMSALGAAPVPIPLGPLYALQLAQSYVGLAIPASAARIAVNVRFFQRHGLPPGSALAVGALDSFSGFVVQAGLLVGILLLTPASLDLHLDDATTGGLGRLLAVVALLGLAAMTVLLAVPRWRRAVVGRVRQLAAEALGVVRGLRRRVVSACSSAGTWPAICCSRSRWERSRSPSAIPSGSRSCCSST